jgi:hypothetical protein
MRATFLAIGMLAAFAWACGSDGGGAPVTPDPDVGKSVEKEIKAADGGTVETASGGAKLDIPAGALDKDTKITIATQAATGEAVTAIYDCGPDGTTFTKPVAMAIKFDGVEPAERKAVLAYQDKDGKWVEIEGSKLADGKVTGSVTHFTKYTVILLEDKIVVTSSCEDVAKNFQACGGDPKGSWKLKDLCFETAMYPANPDPTCLAATAEFDITWTGTIDVTDTTITQSKITMTNDATLKVPSECNAFAGCKAGEIDKIFDIPATCTSTDALCTCTGSQTKDTSQPATITAKIEGSNFVVTDSDGKTETVPFCVSGDTCVVKLPKSEDPKSIQMYYVLQRI